MGIARRLTAVLVGLLLVAGLTAGLGSVSPAGAAAKQAREITINGKEPKENKFVIKGKIAPGKGKIKALIESYTCGQAKDCKKKWKTYKRITTNAKGRYSERVAAPKKGDRRAYYRVRVEPNKRYKGAASDALFIEVIYF